MVSPDIAHIVREKRREEGLAAADPTPDGLGNEDFASQDGDSCASSAVSFDDPAEFDDDIIENDVPEKAGVSWIMSKSKTIHFCVGLEIFIFLERKPLVAFLKKIRRGNSARDGKLARWSDFKWIDDSRW